MMNGCRESVGQVNIRPQSLSLSLPSPVQEAVASPRLAWATASSGEFHVKSWNNLTGSREPDSNEELSSFRYKFQ